MTGEARSAALQTGVREAAAPTPRQRFVCLDWARGWLIIVNLLALVFASAPGASSQLRHASWFGVTLFDLIFPTFVCLSGCGLAFAYRRPVRARVTARRVVVLFALGMGYNAALERTLDLSQVRVTGPLQVYAVLTLVVALLHLRLRSTRAWAIATLGYALALGVVFALFDRTCALGQASRACNLSAATDLRLLPDWMLYRGGDLGHDPEGLMTVLGALVTLGVGITAGRIMSDRVSPSVIGARLSTWSVIVLVGGVALMPLVQPYKRLWTPSFGLVTGALVTAVLLVGWLLHDAPTPRGVPLIPARFAALVIAHGRNPLLIYFGSHLVLNEFSARGDPSLLDRLLVADWPWGYPVVTCALALTGAWTVVAVVLDRKKIYIRA